MRRRAAFGAAVGALSSLAMTLPAAGQGIEGEDDCVMMMRDLELDPEMVLGADRIREMALALGESEREALAEALIDSLPWQPKE